MVGEHGGEVGEVGGGRWELYRSLDLLQFAYSVT